MTSAIEERTSNGIQLQVARNEQSIEWGQSKEKKKALFMNDTDTSTIEGTTESWSN